MSALRQRLNEMSGVRLNLKARLSFAETRREIDDGIGDAAASSRFCRFSLPFCFSGQFGDPGMRRRAAWFCLSAR